ncbi:PREDICTED: myosin ID heavy chain-like [Cyphomyrmex costatus]|uniref:myosin ID heavy chain-like n=1 Tax=Cyphomyrmex costatus TaxID=456900 RepID=UPI0008523C62|nr:PREDICTED: myosin ID heavy chain-like [Cyphomyrmex costatus]
MASTSAENSKGARRRTTGLPTRVRVPASLENGTGGGGGGGGGTEDGRDDSGLSSESSTPTNGSPPPRQPRTPTNGQTITSTSIGVTAASTTAVSSRAKNSSGRIGSDRMSRLLRSRSGTESPRSLDNMRNRQVSSPMRTSGSVSSSCVDSGDEASLRIDRGTYQYMFQDIVSIKTMLLKLKRVLQETETLNPFDNPKNGLFCNLNEGGSNMTDVSTSPGSGGSSIADELADLRRQVVFLQGQVEDRDRTIQVRDRTIELLELQMSKLQEPKNGDTQSCTLPTRNINVSSGDTCNAATQTEKTRPVSAGPSLLQSLPQDGVMGPLVSWSDSLDRQRPSLLSELNSAGSHRKPIERLPHTLRLRQEQTPIRRINVHARRHSSECVSGSPIKPKNCVKSPCDLNDAEQHDAKIYTWVGTLLLAINPSGEIATKDIYNLSQAHEYDNVCDVTCKEVSPHIFAVAARAHYRIVQGLGKPSQVIVLNGETGTGKTFNAWKALEFLTASPKTFEAQGAVCDIVRRISVACRLISAFTTAPTEINKVSSRNVQLVWLEYKMGSICGATISSYLLERDRVTKGCCNFQIFGQMMSAIGNVSFADFKLSMDTRYFMVSDLDSPRVRELCDDFYETTRAMDVLGFTGSQKKDIFFILSLLIHMGNIQFVQEDDRCKIDMNDQQSREALKNTCRLACIKEEDIVELLTSTLINPQNTRRRHTICRRNLNTRDACRYRLHSIIRHLYDLLVCWLINFVNEILSARLYSERLGILDIFGFECFNSNGIEQLCINFVNEKLQQYFVENYLVSCRNDLQKEGLIDDKESLFIVQLYEDRISTIEKYLFSAINDMCLSTVPNNSSTLIHQVNIKNCPATRRFLNVKKENFVIHHYSATVEYSACDLLSKNTDKIPDEITITFSVSTNKFLHSLIANNPHQAQFNGKTKKPTMLSKLRYNVDLLIQELNKCDMHYVRCIKPQKLNSHEWNRDNLRKQLANTGVLDALPLARCKYPVYFTYWDFFKRYNKKRTETCSNLHMACKNILKSFCRDDDNSSVYYGKRLIFLKESIFLRLEAARRRYRAECVCKIESFWLKYKNYTQHMEEDITDDTQEIVSTNIQNEVIEESQLELKTVVPVSRMNCCAEQHESQNIKGTSENMEHDAQAIVKKNLHEQSQFERSLSKYERILPIQDYLRFVSGKRVKILTRLVKRTAYVLHWLDDVNKAKNTKKNKSSILQLLREDNSNNESDSNSIYEDIQLQDHKSLESLDDKFHMQNKHEENLGHYNEKEDLYTIQCGASMLFYKNGILSRRRPARLPIRVHTRLRCLPNSHYLVHTELPQGLQDCL